MDLLEMEDFSSHCKTKKNNCFTDVDTYIVAEEPKGNKILKNTYDQIDLFTRFCANMHSLTSSFSSSHKYRRVLGIYRRKDFFSM
jgi:hypothetical protein